jgi:hypothetical protein
METTLDNHKYLVKIWAYGFPIQYREVVSNEWKNWYRPFCPVWNDNLRFRVKPDTVFEGRFKNLVH